MSFDSITNRAEFFSNHYLDAIIGSDLKGLRDQWEAIEEKGGSTARSRVKSLPKAFFDGRAEATEASQARQADATSRPVSYTHLTLPTTPYV